MIGKATFQAVWMALAAACLVLPSGQAMAASYHIEFSNTRFIDLDGSEPVFGGEFTVETAEPITSAGDYATSACALSGAPARFSCAGVQRFDPSDTGTGKSLVGVYLNYVGYDVPLMGFLWFEDGAFLTEGVHTIFTGAITDGTEDYENFAEVGRLTVQLGAVPEPSVLMLVAAGLGISVLSRRHSARQPRRTT